MPSPLSCASAAPKSTGHAVQGERKGRGRYFQIRTAYAILLSITFVELLIGFSLLRVDYALLIALLTAIVDILPVLGTGTVLIRGRRPC